MAGLCDGHLPVLDRSSYFAGQLLELMDIVASTSMLIERELVEEGKGIHRYVLPRLAIGNEDR